ncbi:MAG: hypothetical protein NTU79_06190 [Planctomycetota bacterium]|nr:hypothetical protein [Planctomycetota bacterium]
MSEADSLAYLRAGLQQPQMVGGRHLGGQSLPGDQLQCQERGACRGVIEGACRHLVKDRMERSGMRWTVNGAQPMLNIRAIHQSPDRSHFYQTRIQQELDSLYPHKSLILNYQPCQA